MRKTTADQHPCGALHVSRIPPEQKNGFLRCSAYLLNTAGAKPDRLLSGKFPSLRKSKHRWRNSLRSTPTPNSSRTPQKEPNSVALSARATSLGNGPPVPAVYDHHAGANCSAGKPPPRGNPGL
jgi:hypothetical protein